jgi:outer membrane protein assembly factor BamB
MPRDPQALIYVGIGSTVVALDDRTGEEVWRAKLRASDFTSGLWDGVVLLAAAGGEVYRLDPETGGTVWHNTLKGLGRGIVSLASVRAPAGAGSTSAATAKKVRDQQAAAAAAAAAG